MLNILETFNIPKYFDLLIIFGTYSDYWILERVLTSYSPEVIVHDINQQGPDECVTVEKVDEIISNDGSSYFSANICALFCLAQRFDYSMVYCESTGFYCFWVRNDLLSIALNLIPGKLNRVLNTTFLYKKAGFERINSEKIWHQVEKCY